MTETKELGLYVVKGGFIPGGQVEKYERNKEQYINGIMREIITKLSGVTTEHLVSIIKERMQKDPLDGCLEFFKYANEMHPSYTNEINMYIKDYVNHKYRQILLQDGFKLRTYFNLLLSDKTTIMITWKLQKKMEW